MSCLCCSFPFSPSGASRCFYNAGSLNNGLKPGKNKRFKLINNTIHYKMNTDSENEIEDTVDYMNEKMPFGKYKGKIISEVIEDNKKRDKNILSGF